MGTLFRMKSCRAGFCDGWRWEGPFDDLDDCVDYYYVRAYIMFR